MMACHTIHIFSRIHGFKDCLKETLPGFMEARIAKFGGESDHYNVTNPLIALAEEAEIAIIDGPILIKLMPYFKYLKWAHCTWAGVEAIVKEVHTSGIVPNFILTRHVEKKMALAMGEYVLLHILTIEKKARQMFSFQLERTWAHEELRSYRMISELKIGILGVGNMGHGVAAVLKGLGSTNIYGFAKSPKRPADCPNFDMVSLCLEDVIYECDYIINTLPETEETKFLLDDDTLELCHKKPVLINVGRASIISEASLIRALRHDWISGVILDVFENEPLPQSSSLWNMPKVVITPHIAAVSKPIDILRGFYDNLDQYRCGLMLENTVDWNKGY